VQEWEQPPPKLIMKPNASSRDTPAPVAGEAGAGRDEPSPAVVPVYVRPLAKTAAATGTPTPAVAAPPLVHEAALSAPQAAMVEAVAQGLAQMLVKSMHAVVVAAVRAAMPDATPAKPPAVTSLVAPAAAAVPSVVDNASKA